MNDDAWMKRYNELRDFKNREGHCNVPQHYKANRSLGTWVNRQRTHYRYMREGKPSSMTSQRVKSLQDIGLKWNLNKHERSRSTYDAAWLLMYEELKTFKCREGHCNVPQHYSANESLGRWVNKHRIYYKYMVEGKPTSITEQRIKALNAIGFSWSMRNNNMKTKTPAPTPCLVPSNPSVS